MTAAEAKKIFQAIAEANQHPDPREFAETALAAWKGEKPEPQAADADKE